jgi:hypothetical protein
MMQSFRYECPKCGAGMTIKLDLPAGEIPKYPPSHQNEPLHHHNRVVEWELVES